MVATGRPLARCGPMTGTERFVFKSGRLDPGKALRIESTAEVVISHVSLAGAASRIDPRNVSRHDSTVDARLAP